MMAVNAIHQRRRWAVASVGAIAAWEDGLVQSVNLQGSEQHPASPQTQHVQLKECKNAWLKRRSLYWNASKPAC